MRRDLRLKSWPVFPADGGFRIVRRVLMPEGEMQVQMEALDREHDPTSGDFIGFRIAGAAAGVDSKIASRPTSVAITPREMLLNLERSRTRGLREPDRLARLLSGRPAEDDVERAQAKIRVWPLVGAARGDILRAWPV